MPQTCPKCHRANPADALYCYEDGFSLGGRAGQAGPVDPGQQPFPHPFVFPNGAACRNFDQLALACHNEWATALELLRTGDLANFLAGLGRADLAKAAREASRQDDKDRALDQLLGQLPANTIEPAKLHVETLQVNLGQLTVGKDHRWEVRLSNQGMRLLSGTIASDCDWLALGEGGGSPRKVFQFQSGTVIPVQVRGKLLRAAAKPIKGLLAVETNGGTATVVVTAEVPVKPFSEGVLAGAITPRNIAEKAKGAPKIAAPLFESGAVARWYIQNGWTYPVQGPSASGLGAVQQFFEALGLTTPPKVEVRESSLLFEGKPGTAVSHTLDVAAVEKRPVFASAVSDQSWLRVSKVVLDGRTAHVQLAVDPVPDRPGETLTANLTVRANGNQRFVVPVSLRVLGKPRTVARPSAAVYPGVRVAELLPVAGTFPAAIPDPARPWQPPDGVRAKGGSPPPAVMEVLPLEEEDAAPRPRTPTALNMILPLLPVAFILFGLFVTASRDLVAWALSPKEAGPDVPGVAAGPGAPLIGIQFLDKVSRVQLGDSGLKSGGEITGEAFWDPTMRFGLVILNQTDPKDPKLHKRLTFDEQGLSNNCCVRIDGRDQLFGEQPFRVIGEPERPQIGHWLEQEGDLGKDAAGMPRQGKRSVWVFNNAPNVPITQTVELVAGQESGQLDTCLVRYRIDNKDRVRHSVGLRFLLDTYIGANDGVPFLIPGQDRFCDTQQVMEGGSVPQYIQACENQDLAHPGTIARLQLRLGGNIEPPQRVTLGAYPSLDLGKQMNDPRCNQEKTMWDVPLYDLSILNDSAVAMYWDARPIDPGASRELGFTYGLGDVAAGEGGGKLGLSVGGSFTPGGEISVTAYMNYPIAGQTVTLHLPAGFQLAEGDPTQAVPAPAPGAASRMSPVSWKVKAGGAGDYTVKVDSSNGASQSKKVTIKTRSIFGDN